MNKGVSQGGKRKRRRKKNRKKNTNNDTTGSALSVGRETYTSNTGGGGEWISVNPNAELKKNLSNKLKNLKEEEKQMDKILESQKEKIEEYKEKLAASKNQFADTQIEYADKAQELQAQIDELINSGVVKSKRNTDLLSQKNYVRSGSAKKVRDFNNAVKQPAKEIDRLQHTLRDLRNKHKQLKQQLSNINRQLRNKDKIPDEIDDLQQEIDQLQKENELGRSRLERLKAVTGEKEMESVYRIDIQNIVERIGLLEEEYNGLRNRLDEYDSSDSDVETEDFISFSKNLEEVEEAKEDLQKLKKSLGKYLG